MFELLFAVFVQGVSRFFPSRMSATAQRQIKSRISSTFAGKLDHMAAPSRIGTTEHIIKTQKREKTIKKQKSGRFYQPQKKESLIPIYFVLILQNRL